MWACYILTGQRGIAPNCPVEILYQILLFYGVKGDGSFDDSKGVDAVEWDIFRLETVVLTNQTDVAWLIRLLQVFDHGKSLTTG